MTITASQITDLRNEARMAGDYATSAACCVALGEDCLDHEAEYAEEYDRDTARAECQRVVDEAAAQVS